MKTHLGFAGWLLAAASIFCRALPTAAQEHPDPAVQTVLDLNPQTPPELFRSVVTLSELGYAPLAKPLLERLTQAKLGREELAALARQFGADKLMRLSREKELAPEGAKFATAVIDAADKQSRDPERLAAMIVKLKDPAPGVRRAAMVDLVEGRSDAVMMLIHALSEARGPAEQAPIRDALVEMRSMAVRPLLGALESTDAALRAQTVEVLGRLNDRQATAFLIGPAVAAESSAVRDAARQALLRLVGVLPSRSSAAVALEGEADRYLAGMIPQPPDHEGRIEHWHWDPKTNRPVARSYPAGDTALVLGARLSANLAALDPDNAEYRRRHLATALEAATIRYGYEQSLPAGPGSAVALVASSGADVVSDVLDFAMTEGYAGAATAAAEILGRIGTAELLIRSGAQPAPLARALAHPDRRLRFAALAAVMQLDPQQPYPGSSRVPEALGHFAQTMGTRRVVIGYPRLEEARKLAGLLAGLGYDPEIAATGEQLLKLAAASADVQLVLVHSTIDRPELREVVYRLRRDARTGGVPVGLVARVEDLERVELIAAEDPKCEAFVRPHDVEAVRYHAGQLTSLAARNMLSVEERRNQALDALNWMTRLAADGRSMYDLRPEAPAVETALLVPELSAAAADVLGGLGAVNAQRSLVDLASQPSTPLPNRQAAAEAFARSVHDRGILLSRDEILLQYDRYNASESADEATQQVLGSILDAIEAPSKKPSR